MIILIIVIPQMYTPEINIFDNKNIWYPHISELQSIVLLTQNKSINQQETHKTQSNSDISLLIDTPLGNNIRWWPDFVKVTCLYCKTISANNNTYNYDNFNHSQNPQNNIIIGHELILDFSESTNKISGCKTEFILYSLYDIINVNKTRVSIERIYDNILRIQNLDSQNTIFMASIFNLLPLVESVKSKKIITTHPKTLINFNLIHHKLPRRSRRKIPTKSPINRQQKLFNKKISTKKK
jgi:hypothetical protein